MSRNPLVTRKRESGKSSSHDSRDGMSDRVSKSRGNWEVSSSASDRQQLMITLELFGGISQKNQNLVSYYKEGIAIPKHY